MDDEITADLVEAVGRTVFQQLTSTALLTVGLIVLWAFITYVWLGRAELTQTQKRRWRSSVRGVFILTFVLGLFYVWAPELRTFALSLVAVAAAIVIATKELLLCLLGGLHRFVSNSAKIGDWISIGDTHGEIVDQTMLAMTLQQLADGSSSIHTGRKVVVPNSLLLSTPIVNHSDLGDYVVHEIVFPEKAGADLGAYRSLLIKAAEESLATEQENAKSFWRSLSDLVETDLGAYQPRVFVRSQKPDQIDLVLQCLVPLKRRSQIEDAIYTRYLDLRDKSLSDVL